ncbi:peptidase dimerization domain-containing protein [Streptomyces sp. NBC_00443]|uniref:peptidase dimerization domain-containing protein n=1 Tax=Streptomyces sp. NBC_00443 TaxID=2975743 RepID=UPI002E1A1783
MDPILAAAAVVMRLQGIVARESAPAEQTTLTVGSLHAGTHSNVVPESAALGITVRALTPAALDRAVAAVERIVRAEATASGCPREPEITMVSRSPVTLPDEKLTVAIRDAHREALGAERVAAWPASMATEDFGLYGDAGREIHGYPGCRSATGWSAWWARGSGPRRRARATRRSASRHSRPTTPPSSPRTCPSPCRRRPRQWLWRR